MCCFQLTFTILLGRKYKLPKHNGVVKKFAELAIRNELPAYRPERVLQDFFTRCIVDTSLQLGILGNQQAFSVAADGTPFHSGASHYGVKVCKCKFKGIFNCKCPRRYSDPDATWGWDSYREQWFYGDTLFCITASDSPYDLPVYLVRPRANAMTLSLLSLPLMSSSSFTRILFLKTFWLMALWTITLLTSWLAILT
jgi:hypothetical protein